MSRKTAKSSHIVSGWQQQDKQLWSGFSHLRVQEDLFKGSPDLHLDFMLLLALWKFILEHSQESSPRMGRGEEASFKSWLHTRANP